MKFLAYLIILVGIVVLFGAFTMDGMAMKGPHSLHWKLVNLMRKSGQASLSFIFYGIFITLAGMGLWWRESASSH